MTNTEIQIIASPYCTLACGRPAREGELAMFFHEGVPMTPNCTHYYTIKAA